MAVLGNTISGLDIERFSSPLTDIEDYSLPPSPQVTNAALPLSSPDQIYVLNTSFDPSKNKDYVAPKEAEKNFAWTDAERAKAVKGVYALSLNDLENKVSLL